MSSFIYSNSKWSKEISETAKKNEGSICSVQLKQRFYFSGLLLKLSEKKKMYVASKKEVETKINFSTAQ